MQKTDISALEEKIDYHFKNKSILTEALTHSSYANELRAKKKIATCNERLEFLGDAVLSVAVSEYLFGEYPSMVEGELTKYRSALVQSSALASYAREIGLGDFLYLGVGEEKSHGRSRQSTLENAFEALVAAIYLDAGENGLDEVRKFVIPIIKSGMKDDFEVRRIDAKTELQQLIQQAEGDFLEYIVVGESGPDHNKEFEVIARLNSNEIGRGKGRSKREAEQAAAKQALKLFGEIK